MNEQAIFLAALDIADMADRAAYVNRTCAGDPTLLGQVEALLAAHERSGEFLDVPALQQIAAGASSPSDHSAVSGVSGTVTSAEHQAAKGDIDLSFLQPSTQPGSLGRLGHYEVQEVIGRGGCGIVLKSFDVILRRMVAIKVMAPELAATSPARKRFLREARAAAAIRHENVVSIHAVEEKPIPFLVMEYIAGQTLQQKLDEHGPLDIQEVVQIGHQIANGLEAAHAIGLIHRDIKPGNILLEKGRDRIKITDFGLARASDDASITQSGVIAGTPLYMSPEQAQGELIDQRSDLFSLGSVLYVMCSGRPPFRAATTMAVLLRVVEDQPRPIQEIIPEVPDWLIAIIAKLLAKKPADRFPSAPEVANLLARCLSEMQHRGRVESLGDVLSMITKPASAAREPVQSTHPPTEDGRVLARSRRWVTAAALLLALLGGLSLTEATGVTNVRGTIIRLFSPDGTLVVEVDDPGVSVSIDGEEMVITGTGAKEIRLKPGQYKVLASKDGKLVRQELVTVTRNGRQVVRVSKEVEATVTGDRPKTETQSPTRFKNTLGMEFALVPKGKSWLGGGGGKPGDKEVEFKDDFYLGIYEVTQEEWQKVTGLTPSHFSRTGAGKDAVKDITDAELKRFPVEMVSWDDAQLFLDRLNKREKEVGWIYRLPTEAEWEYACRGGPMKDVQESVFHYYHEQPTNRLHTDQGNFVHALKRTCKVGSYQPNRLGLYDMHGNAWEWCEGEARNDKGDVLRVPRGGCYSLGGGSNYSSTDRQLLVPSFRDDGHGLRVARVRVSTSGPDRRAAEWVLSIGGGIKITENGKEREFKAVGELPPGAFELTYVELNGNQQVTDAGLAHFKDCKNFTWLSLGGTQVSDAGLAYFKDCKNLTYFRLAHTQVTNAGLAHLKDCKNLGTLDLRFTQVSEAGVKKLSAALPRCKIEWDRGVIGPTASADPDRRAAEWVLSIGGGLNVTENGKERNARELPAGAFELTAVILQANPKVTDAGLAHFKDCKNLTILDIAGTKVSDAGLVHFKDCKNFTSLNLGSPLVSDAGLAHFKDCKNLTQLVLSTTQVSDAGLAYFKDCKNLWYLRLAYTQVNDAGLAHLKDCKNLGTLDLRFTQVSDAGLAHLKDCKNLTDFNLSGTQVSDAGLAHFKDCKNLITLTLAGTPLSDAGLQRLSALAKLGFVNVTKTKVTEAGVKKLAAALPKCKIEWDGGVIGPKQASADQLWEQQVAKLPPADQLKAVAERLKERNLGFDGKFKHVGQQFGEVVILHLSAEKITDLSPIRGLQKLEELVCTQYGKPSKLKDLSPLEGMPITRLNLSFTDVDDLSKLRGLPLTELHLWGAKVSDLGPLRGMKLKRLNLSDCPVTSLDALQGMPLEELILARTRARDLTPVKDCPLKALSVGYCKIADLTLLRGMPLETLDISYTPVTDIGPLKGLKLKTLNFEATKVRDISPLRGMPLTFMWCSDHITDHAPLKGMPLQTLRLAFKSERDAEVLRAIPTLRSINLKSAKDFWNEVAKKP